MDFSFAFDPWQSALDTILGSIFLLNVLGLLGGATITAIFLPRRSVTCPTVSWLARLFLGAHILFTALATAYIAIAVALNETEGLAFALSMTGLPGALGTAFWWHIVTKLSRRTLLPSLEL